MHLERQEARQRDQPEAQPGRRGELSERVRAVQERPLHKVAGDGSRDKKRKKDRWIFRQPVERRGAKDE